VVVVEHQHDKLLRQARFIVVELISSRPTEFSNGNALTMYVVDEKGECHTLMIVDTELRVPWYYGSRRVFLMGH
jgi:hypothetical protein